MKAIKFSLIFLILLSACTSKETIQIDTQIMSNLGLKHKNDFKGFGDIYKEELKKDSLNIEAHLGLAEADIMLFVFGYERREVILPQVVDSYENAYSIDPEHSDVYKLGAIINFLNAEWAATEAGFKKSIEINPNNLNARHWYALYLIAMKRIEEAMAQSDYIMSKDLGEKYLLSRGSFFYFQYRFEEMKPLMLTAIENEPEVPWAYDWLGMAYNGLSEHEQAIETYIKAFNLSDGTVEVGGGLGHALGQAGELKAAKEMADYYAIVAKDNYLPPVQRSFIHLGMEDYDCAIELLEQAYNEKSWFLLFMQIEHWYDPIRKDPRFIDIMERMNFPKK